MAISSARQPRAANKRLYTFRASYARASRKSVETERDHSTRTDSLKLGMVCFSKIFDSCSNPGASTITSASPVFSIEVLFSRAVVFRLPEKSLVRLPIQAKNTEHLAHFEYNQESV